MTFREMIKQYQSDMLEEEQKKFIEEEIEKHEAISDYLYETSEIPGLQELGGLEDEKHTEGETDEAARFADMIRAAIRRAFIKTGLITGAVILVVVLSVMFVLPDVVSGIYYNPNEVVGISKTGWETTRMELDLSVFTELFLPGRHRDTVIAEAEGYGEYRISIPQIVSYSGMLTTVVGKLERNELLLYNPDPLRFPAVNVFVLPKEVGWTYRGTGASGDAERAFARLQELEENKAYMAYFSLDELMEYENLYQKLDTTAGIWCAVYDGDISSSSIGFHNSASGSVMSWDRESYPMLSLLDSEGDIESMEADEASGEVMQTHFLSMLRYMKNNRDTAKVFGCEEIRWTDIINYIEENSMQIYGFALPADKNLILKLSQMENIAYVYVEEIRH